MATLDTRRSIDLALQTDALVFSGLSRELLEPFVRAFLKRADPRDVSVRNVQALIVQLGGLLRFVGDRSGQDILVRVFNTTSEVRGVATPVTVVETCMRDQSFLLDTLLLLFRTRGLSEQLLLHPIIELTRDEQGRLLSVGRSNDSERMTQRESIMHLELDPIDPAEHPALQQAIQARLALAQRVVQDFSPMRQQIGSCIEELTRLGSQQPALESDVAEACALLHWLLDHDFIFVGHVRVNDATLTPAALSAGSPPMLMPLGTWRTPDEANLRALQDATAWLQGSPLLRVDKDLQESPLHRAGRLDRIFIRRHDADGRPEGISFFSGLFTSRGVRQNGSSVPLLRRRLERLLAQ